MKRLYDTNGRAELEAIAIGKGIDVGCNEKPIGGYGCDIDPEVNPNIVCSMEDIPLDDESLDYVVSSHCLEHAHSTIETLKEWHRLLKIGGKVGILVPHADHVCWQSLGDMTMTHRQLYTPSILEKFLKFIGFEIIKVEEIERPYAWQQKPAIVAIAKKISKETRV